MIKIEHLALKDIANTYYKAIIPKINTRIEFVEIALDYFTQKINFQEVIDSPVNGNTKNSILSFFLTQKIKRASDHNLAIPANVEPWITANPQKLYDILAFLKDEGNLKELILVEPLEAYDKDLALQAHFDINKQDDDLTIFKFLNIILDYDLFGAFSYDISTKLGLNACPYCNRVYINTVMKEGGQQIIRPTYDHFFSQSKHPFLPLNFYNLIPSCYYCNCTLKNATTIMHDTHLHPYLDGFGSDALFRIVISDLYPNISDSRNYKVVLQDAMSNFNPKRRKIFGSASNEGNNNLFKIEDVYNAHTDIVGELVHKADVYSRGQANSLKKLFGTLSTNKSEFYQFYFGNYYHEHDYNKRPMAKLTKDVLGQVIPEFFK